MGEERLQELLKHRVTRSLYRDGIFYLLAIRGENRADVESGLLKRSKQAVRALGLLPDEGDIDQATVAALVDRTALMPSPESLAVRIAAVRAAAPEARIEGETAWVGAEKLPLASLEPDEILARWTSPVGSAPDLLRGG